MIFCTLSQKWKLLCPPSLITKLPFPTLYHTTVRLCFLAFFRKMWFMLLNWVPITCVPDRPFGALELPNPSHDVPELNKTYRYPDSEAMKLWKDRSCRYICLVSFFHTCWGSTNPLIINKKRVRASSTKDKILAEILRNRMLQIRQCYVVQYSLLLRFGPSQPLSLSLS